MDPDATLAEALDLSRSINADNEYNYPDDAHRLAELVVALHEWIGERRGYLPAAWSPAAPLPPAGRSDIPSSVPPEERCAGSRTTPTETHDVAVDGRFMTGRLQLVRCATCTGWYPRSLTGLVPDHRVETPPPDVIHYVLPDSRPGVYVED